jgi:hypothetical protein
MKFLVLLAVCLSAVLAFDQCGNCDLDGAWRVRLTTENNDDESIEQYFDGLVDWEQRWRDFVIDETAYNVNGRTNDNQRRDVARQSCKEAKPDRIYNIRWEREIDDFDYMVAQYIYRGFEPDQDAWDGYCVDRVDPATAPNPFPFVETRGGNSFSALKGAFAVVERGNIQPVSGCRVRFRPFEHESRCFVKNDDRRFPTQGRSVQNTNGVGGTLCASGDAVGAHSGQRSLARYGCNQYTWDSDTNDDNIEQNCNRMFFVNEFDRPRTLNTFQPGIEITQSVDVFEGAGTAATPTTPLANCEYRVSGTGFNGITGFNSHPCQ